MPIALDFFNARSMQAAAKHAKDFRQRSVMKIG
jgi:hypothetical protein